MCDTEELLRDTLDSALSSEKDNGVLSSRRNKRKLAREDIINVLKKFLRDLPGAMTVKEVRDESAGR